MPKRIQRKRTKGWRMPPNAISVCRPCVLGNPFLGHAAVPAYRDFAMILAKGGNVARALIVIYDYLGYVPISLSMAGLLMADNYPDQFRKALNNARDKDLACFCPLEKPCHVDVLLELANR